VCVCVFLVFPMSADIRRREVRMLVCTKKPVFNATWIEQNFVFSETFSVLRFFNFNYPY
jgi:hypothetical protein